jgi:DNA-binding transcriptional LysR family regulator
VGLFIERHPDVKVELRLTERNVDLVREGYDLAIRMRTLPDTELVSRKLADLRTLLAASPDYLARRGVPRQPEDLHLHACLRYLLSGRPFPFAFSDGSSIIPDGPFDCDDGGAIREAVLGGVGIGYFLYFTVAEALATQRLIQVLPHLACPTMPVYVVHAYGRQLPLRARLFIDFLVERVGKSEL